MCVLDGSVKTFSQAKLQLHVPKNNIVNFTCISFENLIVL